MAALGPAHAGPWRERCPLTSGDGRDIVFLRFSPGGSACVSVMRSERALTCWIVLVATRA